MALKKVYCVVPLDATKVRLIDYGYSFSYPKDRPDVLYFDEATAKSVATELAIKNPKVPIIVLESTSVVETKTPEIFMKIFKENGDLVPA